MSHARQHSGFATAAMRRGEQYVLCGTCGRRHPRVVIRQAEPYRPPSNLALALGVMAQTLAALIVALLAYGFLVAWLIGGPA